MIATSFKDVTMINVYLNNVEVLDKFVIYIRDRASKLINKACSDRFISGRPIERCNFQSFNRFESDHHMEQSLALIEPKHYYLSNRFSEKVMVPRAEMQCLIKLSNGKSRKDIADDLVISPRTVESHLRNAKIRLKCSTRKEVLNIIESWKKVNTWVLQN